MPRHFLTGDELTRDELLALLDRAAQLKREPLASRALEGRSVALLFEKPSTRTRLSFEAGVFEMGGHPMILTPEATQISRGESIRDTALVFSRHVAMIGVRTHGDERLEELARYASVPVFNMLSAGHHPVQALADLLTLQETFGRLEGLKVAYVGDGNNVARSLAVLGSKVGVDVWVAAPVGYQLEDAVPATLVSEPEAAAEGAHAIYADVWVSMGDEETADERRRALTPFKIDDALLDRGAEGCVALHCLPAHPGEEITAEVLYGERQRIWDQAENRRHAQKALLELLLAGE